MNNLGISQLASVSDLQRNYVALIERIKKATQPLLLLRRNQPEAVLISVDAYDELAEKGRLYEEKMALEAIRRFDSAKKTKRLLVGKKGNDLFK